MAIVVPTLTPCLYVLFLQRNSLSRFDCGVPARRSMANFSTGLSKRSPRSAVMPDTCARKPRYFIRASVWMYSEEGSIGFLRRSR
jgi:hypothetical protein